MDPVTLEYASHRLILTQIENMHFVKAENLVLGETYRYMVDAILSNLNFGSNFVADERKMLNSFVRTLSDYHNKGNRIFPESPIMYVFVDEAEYYVFCLVHDLPFAEQEWFKVIYINASLLNSISIFKQASVSMLKALYPKLYQKPLNLFEKAIKEYDEKFKCSMAEYRSFLEEKQIDRLYHFTDIENLVSIRKIGLCSIAELKQRGISVKYSSSEKSRQIDASKHLEDYVHLSYDADTPMRYKALCENRLDSFVMLEVSPEVIFWKHTKYSDINAADGGAAISSEISFFVNLNFDGFHNKNYLDLDELNRKQYQAEVLVKNNIPTSSILNIESL